MLSINEKSIKKILIKKEEKYKIYNQPYTFFKRHYNSIIPL
jgi:hypothetical protein